MRQCTSEGAADGDDAGPIVFEPSAEELKVIDTVERQQHRLVADSAIEPTPAPTDQFTHPVDDAIAFSTASLRFPRQVNLHVISESGTRQAIERDATTRLSEGTHVLELEYLFKLYVSFSGPGVVEVADEQARVEFPDRIEVAVGARSTHEHPAATITTTTNPVHMMDAVSAMSSALKTTSVERSFPTLRGHPPLLELGDELYIPDELSAPDTDLVIEVPAEYRSVYVVAPLAFYLGAELSPAREPALVAGETTHSLGTGTDFEQAVERVLKHVFTLDCVTRTEGLYPVPLNERQAIESAVDVDFSSLYDASPAERVNAYLDVPFETVEPHVPEWKQTTHVAPTPEQVELLPFLLDDLAIVKSPQTQAVGDATLRNNAVEAFMRNETEAFTRSSATVDSGGPSTVRPEDTGSVEQSWIGDGAPLGASKPIAQAFHNQLNRTHSDGPITITVVCNDDDMASETDIVDGVYGDRELMPFDVTVHRNLSTDELLDVLDHHADFFHFIGHVDGEGFKCADGVLDGDSIDDVSADAFFLNACQSYDLGLSLIKGGAIAGVSTVRDVVNRGAEEIGVAVARLLNLGFSLNAALDIASKESVMGNRYVVVGNGGFAVTQCECQEPNVSVIERSGSEFEISFRTYPQGRKGMGTLVQPRFENNTEYYIGSGHIETFSVSKSALDVFLSLSRMPVRVDGELRWSDELTGDEVCRLTDP